MERTRIIVVEDESIVAMDIQERLESLGYEVPAIVQSGKQAIEKAESLRPDLVLMDIQLQGEMDGVDAADEIRRRFNIPVVYLTANADHPTVQRAKLTEPFGYLMKPFEERELHTAVEMAVYKHRTDRRLKESEEWLAAVLSGIGEGVIATDQLGSVTFMNPVAERLTGWSQEEALGSELHYVFSLIDEDTRTVIVPGTRALSHEVPTRLPQARILIRKDGAESPVDDKTAPIKNSQDKIIGWVTVFRDLSDKRREEVERQLLSDIVACILTTATLDELFSFTHDRIKKLLSAENCFIALHDQATDLMTFEFWADKVDPVPASQPLGKGFASYIQHTNRPLLLTQKLKTQLYESGEVEKSGTSSASWIGVPLRTRSRAIGVLVVQHYEQENAYSQRDLEFLAAVGDQLGLVIERKQIEEDRKTKEMRMSEAQTIAHLGSWDFDALTGGVIWSDELWRIFGLTPREFGLTLEEYLSRVHPDDYDAVKRINEESQRERKDVSYDYRILRPDHTIRVLRAEVRIICNESGEIVKIVGTDQDITEEKEIEEARRREQEERDRFSALGADLQVIAGFDGQFKWVNPASERTLGWNSEELTSQTWLHFVHPEDHEKTIAEAEKLFLGEETVSFENRYRHKDGSYRWMSWNARPYLQEQSLYCAAADITDRKELEEQLRQSQKLECIGQLAGGVAHDFNNLLTVITGYGEMCLNSLAENDPLRGNLEEIKTAAERAASLTRQLLAFSRKQILQPKIVDLTTTVRGLDQMLQRLIGEDVELVTILEPKLGTIRADPSQIEQVLMNLAVNARDAMPTGGKLTIETKNVSLNEAYARTHIGAIAGPHVMLAVSDTGQGMDASTQARIFEPFFTTKEQGKGTGLGLAMVYGIVKQSGGNIWVYSEPEHGTVFKVYLPIVEEPFRDEGAVILKPSPGTETVLLVEDEGPVLLLLLKILESHGYTVLTASNGQDAINIWDKYGGPIHLLMTDVVMPGMSGRQLVGCLTEKNKNLRVLYMSGYTDDAIVHHGVLDPGLAFLAKPFTPDAAAHKVREVLDSVG